MYRWYLHGRGIWWNQWRMSRLMTYHLPWRVTWSRERRRRLADKLSMTCLSDSGWRVRTWPDCHWRRSWALVHRQWRGVCCWFSWRRKRLHVTDGCALCPWFGGRTVCYPRQSCGWQRTPLTLEDAVPSWHPSFVDKPFAPFGIERSMTAVIDNPANRNMPSPCLSWLLDVHENLLHSERSDQYLVDSVDTILEIIW